jgi:hypothetical protein
MGKLMRTTGRVLGAVVLVLAGAGILVLAGTGIAAAQPVSTAACQDINATLASLDSAFSANPTSLKSAVATIASKLTQAASTGSPAVKNAVSTFVADLEAAAASGQLNEPKLTADGDAIVALCPAQATAPSGAPATGGGSAAGVQDPGLFGVGGAIVLAGLVVLGLARRNGSRAGAGHG